MALFSCAKTKSRTTFDVCVCVCVSERTREKYMNEEEKEMKCSRNINRYMELIYLAKYNLKKMLNVSSASLFNAYTWQRNLFNPMKTHPGAVQRLRCFNCCAKYMNQIE